MNGCAPGLALIERLNATRKCAIDVSLSCFCPVIDHEFRHSIVKVLWVQEAIAE